MCKMRQTCERKENAFGKTSTGVVWQRHASMAKMLTFLRLDLYVMVLHHPTTTSLDNIAFSEILPRATCLGDDVSGINYMIAQANQRIRRFCRITTCPYIAHPACNAMKHDKEYWRDSVHPNELGTQELSNDLNQFIFSNISAKEAMPKYIAFKGRFDVLSNFYMCKINYNGEQFSSVEHAYQTLAARTCSPNSSINQRIKLAATASEAKSLSHCFEENAKWQGMKVTIMKQLQSFSNVCLKGHCSCCTGNGSTVFW